MDRPQNLPWLLVATPQLLDANFRRAVVLIVEHNDEGSMGFVINRPIQAPLADLVTVPHVEIPANVPAWYGGPVERGTGIILHNQPRPLDASAKTSAEFHGLALSSSEQSLIDLVDYSVLRTRELEHRAEATEGKLGRDEALYPYRFLVGYSGWGADQLDDELKQGAWIQVPASQDLIFNTSWKSLWDAALGQVGVNPKTLAPSVHQFLN